MRELILIEYSQYSQEIEDYLIVGVYLNKEAVNHHFGLKNSEDKLLENIIEKISSNEAIDLIEKYGC